MAGNIAKAMITLESVGDGFSLSLSPNTCVIKADFDGKNPLLDSAYTDISLRRGDQLVKYQLNYQTSSNGGIKHKISQIDEYTQRIQLTEIPTTIVSGYLIFNLVTDEDYNSSVTFQFSVIRESSMLDWIKEWETNKTTIGSTYLITPKIFVGKKITTEDDLKALTGVYIGPDDNSAGIYGYKAGQDIFHINESGGSIGGWDINNGGIQTEDGLFKILSEGTIKVLDEKEELIWGIQKTGDAVFSRGKVRFERDGSAFFEGSITSGEGNIGGWIISQSLLYSDYLVLDSSKHYIGISPFKLSTLDSIDDTFNHKTYVEEKGGVCMFYTSANSYGIGGYLPAKISEGEPAEIRQVFSLGSVNHIAGWSMSEKRLSSAHIALVSDNSAAGIYMSTDDIGQITSSNLAGAINKSSGIYLYSTEHEAKLVGMKESEVIFLLSSTTDSVIAGWNFNNTAIFKGVLATSGFTQSSGDITISSEGLRGHKWRFDADGYGAIAGGEIYWNEDGIHFGENVKLSWNNFSDEAKEDMQDGLLPDWVNDWDKVENKTEIDGEYIVSPKLFSGTKDSTSGELTGIAMGHDCISIDGVMKTGLFAIDNGKVVFELDPLNQKYRFSGTILAQVDKNNVWEIDESCVQYVGNKQGQHIEINPTTSDIKIFDNNNNQVSTLEGNSYNLADFWGGVIPTLTTKNLPAKIDGAATKLGTLFEFPICESIVVNNNTTSLSYQLGIATDIDGDTEDDYFQAYFYLCNYSSEPIIENFHIPEPDVKILLYSLRQERSSGYQVFDKSTLILPKGFNVIICQGHAKKSSAYKKCNVEIVNFPLLVNATSYIANYFANGIAIGDRSTNLFSIINNEYKNYDDSVTTTLELHAYNDQSGIKIERNGVYIKRRNYWGFIPSLLYSGRIVYNPYSIYFSQINSRSWNDEYLSIVKVSTGVYDITFPETWKKAGITFSSCHFMLQQITSSYENTTTGFFCPMFSSSADFRVEMRNLSNQLFNGSFYLEIKHY